MGICASQPKKRALTSIKQGNISTASQISPDQKVSDDFESYEDLKEISEVPNSLRQLEQDKRNRIQRKSIAFKSKVREKQFVYVFDQMYKRKRKVPILQSLEQSTILQKRRLNN